MNENESKYSNIDDCSVKIQRRINDNLSEDRVPSSYLLVQGTWMAHGLCKQKGCG